ncbi:UbiA prenyltransferase family-domain-containing protein [Irpex lacteus]|nr:UbiA prenyltransferase family-domain-containing protein [Irpex lacteus]
MPKMKRMAPDPPEPAWWLYFKLMRLHGFPIGTKLPFTALAFSMFMGLQSIHARSLDSLYHKAGPWWLFVFVRHSGGCVWNDICDRDIDCAVERTKNRPLASGRITVRGAGSLLFTLLVLCLWILRVASGNNQLFLLGVSGLAAIDMPYPLMKRWISLPQLYVGASIAWPIPIAWISVTGGSYDPITLIMLCLAFGGSTFILDTIYACQDRSDDIKAGVQSATILFGSHLRGLLSALAAMVVTCLFIIGVRSSQGSCYFLITVSGLAATFAWQLQVTDFNNKQQCRKALAAYSNGINFVIWAGAVGDHIMRSSSSL